MSALPAEVSPAKVVPLTVQDPALNNLQIFYVYSLTLTNLNQPNPAIITFLTLSGPHILSAEVSPVKVISLTVQFYATCRFYMCNFTLIVMDAKIYLIIIRSS